MVESPRVADPGSGGFLPSRSSLPSPSPSTASSRVASLLPHPRSKPLVPGSKKEDYARDYVARRLLHISRRYVKKFGIPDPADEVTGYEGMEEVCRDLEEVVDVLWFSGTPSLQIPYLLNVALAFNSYLPSFTPASWPTFALLRKLDHCFASLLVGYDIKTKDRLAGFASATDNSTRSRFSRTDMVRCKSLADETRMLVAMVMSGEADVVDYDEDEVEVSARRPARARSEARSVSVESPDSASQGFLGAEMMKTEEGSDEDLDDLEFISVHEEPTATTKRKAEEMVDDVAMNDATTEFKRIKVEDEEGSPINLNDSSSKPSMSSSLKPEGKGQFHWALEEDDDSSDDGGGFSIPVFATGTRDTGIGGLPPTPPRVSNLNTVMGDGHELDDAETHGGGELIGEYDEDEEEDEELQMNVGRVYQKTMIQLGKSLGESIIDE